MSRKATEFQKKEMSKMYRGKEIFKPLNTGWVDEHVACVREWVANIFFVRKGETTLMIDAGYNYDRLEEKMGWLGIDPASIRDILITHQDTDHVHFHFVTNTVSYLDGSMAHWSKHDLKAAKKLCNEMCQERGWQIPQKGHHHDGTAFEDGEITAWSKDKYHALIANPKQSYLVDAVIAIQNCTPYVQSREEFCAAMERDYGWKVVWEDKKKHITFINCLWSLFNTAA